MRMVNGRSPHLMPSVQKRGAILGLPPDSVWLHSYTPLWRWLFWVEKLRLWLHLRRQVKAIVHVGSTAVPGMPAKPILDILFVVSDYKQGAVCTHRLESLGYTYLGENAALQQYRLCKGRPQTHGLTIVTGQSAELAAKIAFRDYLRQHPAAARAYAQDKRRHVQQFSGDRAAYQAAKAAFIQQTLRQIEGKGTHHECG